MKIWGSLAELSQDTELWERCEHGHAAAPHMSMRGASAAPHQHQGHPGSALQGVPLTLSSDAGTPWNLACTRHTSRLSPSSPASGLRQLQEQETGRKANTAGAAGSQWLLQGQLAALSLRLDLITPAPAPVSSRLSASHCLRCAGQDHCYTLSQSLREYM